MIIIFDKNTLILGSYNSAMKSKDLNKQNVFHDNQPSTDIQDSCSKSYSSRYLLKKKKVSFNQILPSRYQKAAVIIQKFWRFRQSMKRKYYTQILQNTTLQNECYLLQNQILLKKIDQYKNAISYNKKIKQLQIRQKFEQIQTQISQIVKKCVATTFKMQKKKPSPQMFETLMDEKQIIRQRNFLLNRQKMIFRCKLNQQMKREEQIYLRQIKQMNIQHLQTVKIRSRLQKQYQEVMLQTSKFGQVPSQQSTQDLDLLGNCDKLTKKRSIEQIFNDFDQSY